MTNIAVLAEREARAEASKSKADSTWRAAWWATTLALGAIPVGEKRQIGEAQALVRATTGQSSAYVSGRTRTGRAFGSVDAVETLLPTMANEVVKSGLVVDAALVRQIIKAEKDGIGVREFIASLTGRVNPDTVTRASSQAQIDKIVRAHPERVAKAVAEQPAAREQVVKRVVASPQGRREIEKAKDDHTREGLARHGIDPDFPIEPFDAELLADAIRIKTRISGCAHDLNQLLRRAEPDQRQRLIDEIEPAITRLLNAISPAENSAEGAAR